MNTVITVPFITISCVYAPNTVKQYSELRKTILYLCPIERPSCIEFCLPLIWSSRCCYAPRRVQMAMLDSPVRRHWWSQSRSGQDYFEIDTRQSRMKNAWSWNSSIMLPKHQFIWLSFLSPPCMFKCRETILLVDVIVCQLKWMQWSGPMPWRVNGQWPAAQVAPCAPQPFFTLEACRNGGKCVKGRFTPPSLVVLLGNVSSYFDTCLWVHHFVFRYSYFDTRISILVCEKTKQACFMASSSFPHVWGMHNSRKAAYFRQFVFWETQTACLLQQMFDSRLDIIPSERLRLDNAQWLKLRACFGVSTWQQTRKRSKLGLRRICTCCANKHHNVLVAQCCPFALFGCIPLFPWTRLNFIAG